MCDSVPPTRFFPEVKDATYSGGDYGNVCKDCQWDMNVYQPDGVVHIVISRAEEEREYQKCWDS
jgi:hypothetical protein